jgi:hypothetical protein
LEGREAASMSPSCARTRAYEGFSAPVERNDITRGLIHTVPGHDRADTLGRGPERIIEQVSIAGRRPRLSVAEQGADHRQAQPGACEHAGIGVSQVVHAAAFPI